MNHLTSLKTLKIPKVQLALALILISLQAILLNRSSSNTILIITALALTVLFDLLFTFFKTRKFFIPYSALITGLIIGLLIDPSANFFQILVISLIAMGLKNFLRLSERHIFNPAAIGLVLGGALLSLPVAWWGATLPNAGGFAPLAAFLIILLPSYVSAYRMKRYGSIAAFLITYALITLFQQQSISLDLSLLQGSLLNPSILFFALVMLPEPMTSPSRLKRQILFGALTALLIPILSWVFLKSEITAQIYSIDPILIPLLFCNLLFFKYR
jgi:enediyne biosynthesis protein E5